MNAESLIHENRVVFVDSITIITLENICGKTLLSSKPSLFQATLNLDPSIVSGTEQSLTEYVLNSVSLYVIIMDSTSISTSDRSSDKITMFIIYWI